MKFSRFNGRCRPFALSGHKLRQTAPPLLHLTHTRHCKVEKNPFDSLCQTTKQTISLISLWGSGVVVLMKLSVFVPHCRDFVYHIGLMRVAHIISDTSCWSIANRSRVQCVFVLFVYIHTHSESVTNIEVARLCSLRGC